MRVNATVFQIKPDFGDASYINIDEAGKGGLKIWFSAYLSPTYIARKKQFVFILQFANQTWADEWMEENNQYYDHIEKLKS